MPGLSAGIITPNGSPSRLRSVKVDGCTRKAIARGLCPPITSLFAGSGFLIDFGLDKACNLHVAQRPLTKGVLFAPGDSDVTGDSEKSRNRPWAAINLNSPNPLYPSEN